MGTTGVDGAGAGRGTSASLWNVGMIDGKKQQASQKKSMKTGMEKLIFKTTAFSIQGKDETRSEQYMLAESRGQEKQQTLPGEDCINK